MKDIKCNRMLKYNTSYNTYYIPINTRLFPAGTVCCLGHVLACVPSSGSIIGYNYCYQVLGVIFYVGRVDPLVHYPLYIYIYINTIL